MNQMKDADDVPTAMRITSTTRTPIPAWVPFGPEASGGTILPHGRFMPSPAAARYSEMVISKEISNSVGPGGGPGTPMSGQAALTIPAPVNFHDFCVRRVTWDEKPRKPLYVPNVFSSAPLCA